jgi:hypothetical protein
MTRTLLLGSAWTASAAAAVGLGFLAVSLVDASASSGGQPAAAALTTSPGASPVVSEVSAPATPAPAGQQTTAGGTVYGSCDGDVPVVASAPAAGWWLDDSSDPATIEFKNATQHIDVRVTCVGGVAQFSVEGPRSEDSGHGADDATTAPAATTYSSGDDSDGRVGGGHGSDDATTAPAATSAASGAEPGDDSSGRHGGGHGSDD